jgi:hypothetical protein
MIKTASLLALAITALASMPAQAQQRVFVASLGLDTNPCNVAQPRRTFQHAHDIAPANSEIEVVDPAGYGPLTRSAIRARLLGGRSKTGKFAGLAPERYRRNASSVRSQ